MIRFYAGMSRSDFQAYINAALGATVVHPLRLGSRGIARISIPYGVPSPSATWAQLGYQPMWSAMLDAARDFFNLAIEEKLVRALAVTLKHIPANVDVLRCSAAEVTALRAETFGKFDFIETPWDAAGFIKGSEYVRFPEGGPTCKYAALFDSRPEFDHFRVDFIRKDSQNFLQVLQTLGFGLWPLGDKVAAWCARREMTDGEVHASACLQGTTRIRLADGSFWPHDSDGGHLGNVFCLEPVAQDGK